MGDFDGFIKLKDNFDNEIEIEKLNYNFSDKLSKGKKVRLKDFQKNFYKFESALIDFSTNKIIADNVNIDFNKNIFGNPLNDPRLKGNYFLSDGKDTIIKKGVFTTCKKNSDKCPPWNIQAKKMLHDNKKKTIYGYSLLFYFQVLQIKKLYL